ncbi:MAG: hypothetical protein ABIR78_14785 [Ferruginibacter sp.]
MKLNNLFIAATAAVSVFAIGCNAKKKKDLVVAKWQITNITGKGGDMIPDSLKQVMYKEANVEFKSDGKYVTNGMGAGTKTGIYHLTADEKGLITVEDGSTTADTVNLVELTAGKMVVTDNKGDIKISFKSH